MLASCQWPPVQSIQRPRFWTFSRKSVNVGQNEGVKMLCQNKWNTLIPTELCEVSEVSRYRCYWRTTKCSFRHRRVQYVGSSFAA